MSEGREVRLVFDLSKDWSYRVRATPTQCEEAFRSAFVASSFGKGKWQVSLEQQDDAQPGGPDHLVVAELVGTNFLRGLTQQGNALGAAVGFGVFEVDERSGTTRCAMAVIDEPRYQTQRMIASARANGDMIKARMKLVTRKLKELDSKLQLEKRR